MSVNPKKKFLRNLIEIGMGFLWFLGISVGLSFIGLCLALAFAPPLTPLALILCVGLAVVLPLVAMIFPHVREWVTQKLEAQSFSWVPLSPEEKGLENTKTAPPVAFDEKEPKSGQAADSISDNTPLLRQDRKPQ